MKKLLSLPPNLVGSFHRVTGYGRDEWFCTHDPIGHKLGSGGGTAWLLSKAYEQDVLEVESKGQDDTAFLTWLSKEKRILLHAGGQSRRLPSYAPSGKILTPIPVFRWERGQQLSQDLLSLQLPLYERMMRQAPDHLHTMVVSGDVLIRQSVEGALLPFYNEACEDADVVCFGLWLEAETAKNHGVFVSTRECPSELKCMLQKPSVDLLTDLSRDHLYLTDIGVWLLSDRAVNLLMQKGRQEYDLYSEFGGALGYEPTTPDEELSTLKTAILPLSGGEFYHFGTSREMISSTLAIQNVVNDQRQIFHRSRKPHPSMFVQNAETHIQLTPENTFVWIENSCVGKHWKLTHNHIITGVPQNDWRINLLPGQCVDIVPLGEKQWIVRPYQMDDSFAGEAQREHRFPVVKTIEEMELVLRWMLGEEKLLAGKKIWEQAVKKSAEEISSEANLLRLFAQREAYRVSNWPLLARNYRHSIFYQLDLQHAATEFAAHHIPVPLPLPSGEPLLTRISDAMFRSHFGKLTGQKQMAQEEEQRAFSELRRGLQTFLQSHTVAPQFSTYQDQIVWGRSPVRIDIAGGWTDTPPFCLMEGGDVINLAIELNGQPPIQTYVKPCREYHVVLRSIDLGASEVVTTYEELEDYKKVGSPFSIPKAALVLAGFHPSCSTEKFATLSQQLQAFGCGIEVTLLSAIPAGSGLGTSSILAATVLGTLNDFCSLGWDKREIGYRTLVLEQLLTTGGGWQDQFGGILSGVKLLHTSSGEKQIPEVRWLPTGLYLQPEYRDCHLLYYTGITRTAKNILSEIVCRMFLNQREQLALLREMKNHTMEMFDAIQHEDFWQMGRLVRKTWNQNQALDKGTNPAEVSRLSSLIDDLCLGYKLPGAGGGGYLYMVAKDPEAAVRIRQILSENRTNRNARFVDMLISERGLQVSRS